MEYAEIKLTEAEKEEQAVSSVWYWAYTVYGNFKETIRKHFEVQNIIKLGLKLNIKKSKVMIVSTTTSLRIDSKDTEVVGSFCFLGFIINRAPDVKKTPYRFALGREAKKDIQMLRKIKNI